MFDCRWIYDVNGTELEKMINQLVDERVNKKLQDIKVRIPQKQINDAVVKFFTEKKWFLTENGQKLDTYDLIRKFAMNTIGVAENGELNSEMLNIVQQEVGKILAEQIYNNAKNKEATDSCQCGGNCVCKEHTDEESGITDEELEELAYSDYDEEQAYNDGYSDGKIDAVNEINKMLADYDTGFNICWDGDKMMLSNKCNKSCSESDENTDKSGEQEDLDFITDFAETLSGSKLTSAQKTALQNLYDVLKTAK